METDCNITITVNVYYFNWNDVCFIAKRQSLLALSLTSVSYLRQARKALADRQKELELKTQQLEIKLSNKIEEDIKKARRKSTQAGQRSKGRVILGSWFQSGVCCFSERGHCLGICIPSSHEPVGVRPPPTLINLSGLLFVLLPERVRNLYFEVFTSTVLT